MNGTNIQHGHCWESNLGFRLGGDSSGTRRMGFSYCFRAFAVRIGLIIVNPETAQLHQRTLADLRVVILGFSSSGFSSSDGNGTFKKFHSRLTPKP
jgi:hypothetical protein